MVKSKLDPRLNYTEKRDIDKDDMNFEANLYETQIYGKTIVFALGQPKYTYIDNNIIFYPMYLIAKDEIKNQIGLYEILATQQSTILDADGDVDLNKFHKPLLFAFTHDYIKDKEVVPATADELAPTAAPAPLAAAIAPPPAAAAAPLGKKTTTKEGKTKEGKTKEGKTKKDKSIKNKTAAAAPLAAATNAADAADAADSTWIKAFMNNEAYDIIDTPHDGHCFFSVLQLALKEQGQNRTIDEMRQILVDKVTEDMFQTYKMLYDDQKANIENLTREITNLTVRHTSLVDKIKKAKDRNIQLGFSKQSDDIILKQKELKRLREQTKENISDVAFMDGVDNLSMLKLKMRTNDYWADSWAISVLEKQLNLKTIIFSELSYNEGDEINVLQCGHLYDEETPDQVFEPSFYVLTCHQGKHYQLITYKQKQSFLFEELPTEPKQLVLDKCLEMNSGAYSHIPDFTAYAAKPLQQAAKVAPELQPALKHNLAEVSSDLYDNATVFRFYSKSADKPAPGKGQGEMLGPEGAAAYSELAKIPQWRRKLSNYWPAEFTLDNHKWLTVEHYYQGNKYKNNNKEFYLQFTLDSKDSSIAKDVLLAKAAGGKSGKLNGDLVRPKGVDIDPDFFKRPDGEKYSRGEEVMESAMRAKFTQNADLKVMLIATKKAKLEHISRAKAPVVLNDLMRVRRDLQMA